MAGFAVNTSRMHWKIANSAKSKQELRYWPGVTILNPYHYSLAYNNQGFIDYPPSRTGVHNYITAKGLLLEVETKYGYTPTDPFHKLPILFRHLRYDSLQSQISINNNIGMVFFLNQDEILPGKLKIETRPEIYYHSHFYNTLLTWKHVLQAENRIFQSTVLPVYEEVVVDAFDAYRDREFSKTILFSTIAIESMLASRYDAIQKRKSEKKRDSKNTSSSSDDPIYKTLKDGPFKRLLHEVPLYLLGRSIMIEEKKLYQGLLKLYNTRNKIVHLGAPADTGNDKVLSINEEGARVAFSLLLDTFNWMKIQRFDVLRTNKHIKIT